MRAVAVVVLALALAAPAAAACERPRASLPSLEGQVMCPVCKTTLDQSHSAAADAIRSIIRQKIARCETAAQIKDELARDFGPRILAAPPRKGFDLLAWWLPIVGILVAAAALGVGVWRWTRTREPEPEPAPVDPTQNGHAPLDPELERRVDAALAEYE